MSVTEVPTTWKRVKFGEIASSVTERVDNPSASGVDRYVGLEHLDPESTHIRRWGSPEDVESTKLRFYAGDVIYGRRRAYQRKLGVADFEGICSAHALVLRAKPAVCLPEFLPYFLQSDAFHERAIDISVGSLSPTINWKTLAIQEFALPPLEEQKKIAEILGLSGLLAERYSQAESNAVLLSRSLLDESFSRATWVPLEMMAAVELGKKRDPKLLREGVPVPYLRAANVKPSEFDLSDVMAMNFTSAETEYFTLRDGDVLVTEGCGSINQVGACAVWRDQLTRPVCFQMTLLRLRARDAGDAKLLGHWAQHAFVSGRFAAVSSGTSVFHLSAARVRKMPFPVLCDDEQRSLVEKLDRLSELVGALQSAEGRALSVHLALREKLLEGSRGHVH